MPKTEGIKLAFARLASLNAELDGYPCRTCEAVDDATTLILHMVEALMARDRAYKRGGQATPTLATKRGLKEARCACMRYLKR
ncbi:DUF2274 domain-containing protein [Pigmentiphaga litoralis]|uniref:Uncharacterized protein n=1 Tax=Pigmentiphaga litoralis TaxID=516702 RepID=A0A7Y9IXJ5_9BURK|nr:DUF2274 domain-containing protein [Pigmentiphaga litoralis]NYE22092.1 hypothetical protein [Pigmentiphaga litoralis]NYE84293.1 hypothetical protein [Pigmentiphaga litoralis]